MSVAENSAKDHFEDEVVETGQRMLMFNVIPSWMISFIGHVALIVLLAIRIVKDVQVLMNGIALNVILDCI